MYPNELQKYPRLQKVPACVIHSFTAMSRIPHTGKSDGSVLLMGAPWFLKGAESCVSSSIRTLSLAGASLSFTKTSYSQSTLKSKSNSRFPSSHRCSLLVGTGGRLTGTSDVSGADGLTASVLAIVASPATAPLPRLIILGSGSKFLPVRRYHRSN